MAGIVRNNPGTAFDASMLNAEPIVEAELEKSIKELLEKKYPDVVAKGLETPWLLKAVSLIDLTTLAGNDTHLTVEKICSQAVNPVDPKVLEKLGIKENLTTAAVCIYPGRTQDAVKFFKNSPVKVPVAPAAAGFPAGQTTLKTKLVEIEDCVALGADEIDIVISRNLVILGQWEELYNELRQIRKACGKIAMKTILATGELPSYDDIYKASMVAMMAGSDFIKTSTGKETVNATLPVGLVMCRAIAKYKTLTRNIVGMKPAGGLRTYKDAIDWMILVSETLGEAWLNNTLLRLGASSLLGDIARRLKETALGITTPAEKLVQGGY